jgi:hypothetical protein
MKIGTAVAALTILAGSSLFSFAQTGGSPSAGERGVAGSLKAEGIGSTNSTHNPSWSSSSPTECRTEAQGGAKWEPTHQRTIQPAKRIELSGEAPRRT